MSNITITTTAEDAASKALRVVVPVERVAEAERKAVSEYGRRVKLPGFRQGKAPAAVVRKRFAPAIRQWVIETVIREGWEQARDSEGLKPISDPSVRNLKYEEGEAVEFELLVEVRPELSLSRLGGFTVAREVQKVTDEMVTEQIDQLRESKASWIPVEGQKPSHGNMVRVEVAALEDGEAKDPQSYTIVVGQGQTVPEVEEQIVLLEPGQTADAQIRFGEDHPDPAKRGTSRTVRITLHDVKRQELPPLDDAFAKEAGDFDDLTALRAAVRADLEKSAEREADARVRDQVLQQVIEANGVEAPASMVERALHAFMHAYEVPPERHEQFHTEFRPVAVSQVQRELVLSSLAEAEKLFATEAEVDARVAEIAARRGAPVGEVYASLEKAKRLPELERAITEEKVFDFLLKQSTVEEK
ncbi:MAG: trigger factor [Gemmatimonadales bacterium]